MTKIVALGAGLTNISVAAHLERSGFYDYIMFEKEEYAGGLCRSVKQDGFTFDYTGHLLHINDDYFRSFLQEYMSLEEDFEGIDRRTFIYSHGVYTYYPFQVNLYGLPPTVIADCIEGFVQRKKSRKKNKSFYDWAVQEFGQGIVNHFFASYQEKIFSYASTKITSTWTGRFVPKTSLADIIKGALNPSVDQKIGYNASFLYPKKGGNNFWVRKIFERLKNPIKTGYCVDSIDVKNKVVFFTNGDFQKYEVLISTLPLPVLLNTLSVKDGFLSRASDKLLCSSVLNINLGLSKKITDKHWIYLPEKKYKPYRVGFYTNFASSMAPPDCSSLYAEVSYRGVSHTEKQEALAESIEQLQGLLGFSSSDILTKKILDIPYAYVIYDFWREKHLASIHAALAEYGIQSVGRYGAWKYSSMQEAILEGRDVVLGLSKNESAQKTFSLPVLSKQLRVL